MASKFKVSIKPNRKVLKNKNAAINCIITFSYNYYFDLRKYLKNIFVLSESGDSLNNAEHKI